MLILQENLYVKSRVAMDFTAKTGGRVVDDPNEAIGVAIEEGQEWRVSTPHTPITTCSQ